MMKEKIAKYHFCKTLNITKIHNKKLAFLTETLRLVKPAIEDIKNGNVYTSEEMRAWINELSNNLVWSAKFDVTNSINRNLLYYQTNTTRFFNNLMDFLEILNSIPYLGKVISNYDFEIRQIIYKKHRILYTIKTHTVFILRVIHIRMNFENNLRFFNNLIS